MAEQLKVFANKEFTNADIRADGTIHLITNLDSEQAVVKSIEVDDNTLNNSLKYRIENDGFTITEDLVNMEGYEIVDKGKALVLDTDVDYENNVILDYDYSEATKQTVYNEQYYVINSTTNVRSYSAEATAICKSINHPLDSLYLPYSAAYKNYLLLKSKYPYSASPVSSEATITTTTAAAYTVPTMSQPVWFRVVGNKAYYFQWDGNSTTVLYKAVVTGTTVDSWSVVNTASYAFKTLDVENNAVYWVEGATLYKYDLVTQTQTTIGTTEAPGISTNSTATFSNGVFFYVVSSSYTTKVYYYNTTTKSFGNINLSETMPISNYTSIAVAYNGTEDKWYINIGYSTSRLVYTTTGAMTGTKTATKIGTQALLPFTLDGAQGIVMGDKTGHMLYKCTNATGGVVGGWASVKWANNTATLVRNIAATFSVGYQNPMNIIAFWPDTITTTTYEVTPAAQTVVLDINEDTIPFSAKLKISGVAITEEI